MRQGARGTVANADFATSPEGEAMSESVTEQLQGLREGFMALTEALRIMLDNQRLHGEMLQRILGGGDGRTARIQFGEAARRPGSC